MDRNTDNEIIELFKNEATKNQAFTMLVEKYKRSVYWIIRRIVLNHHDADDVLQNTFIRIWQGLDSFRGDCKLFSWMYRIAYNESITFLRAKQQNLSLSDPEFTQYLINNLSDDLNDDCTELEENLQKAILQLPVKQRMVFNMRYYEHLSYERLSEIFGNPVGTLKSTYHSAIKKIEKFLNSK